MSNSVPAQPEDNYMATKYSANCHCGLFQYTVTLPRPLGSLPSQIKSCDCSVCLKGGLLLVSVEEKYVEFKKGSVDEFKGYEFGTKVMSHKFCAVCGSTCMIDGRDKFGVLACNIRMIMDVNLEGLEITKSYNVDADGVERWGKYNDIMADVLVK